MPRRQHLLAAGILAGLSLAPAAWAQDAMTGKIAYDSNCADCHGADGTGVSGAGPSLAGVVGRRIGSVPGFVYSAALQDSKSVWTPQKLDAFIAAPATAEPGNEMFYVGDQNAHERADLIAYLKTLR